MRNRFIIFLIMLLLPFLVSGQEVKKDQAEARGITRITARKAEFDYKRSIAVFEGEVVVIDPEVKLQADRLSVSFDENKKIKQGVATGNVKIWYQDKFASGDTAVYSTKDGKFEIQGNALLSRKKDTIKGDKITFWIYDDRLIVEPGTLTIYPEKDGESMKDIIPDRKKSEKEGAKQPVKQ